MQASAARGKEGDRGGTAVMKAQAEAERVRSETRAAAELFWRAVSSRHDLKPKKPVAGSRALTWDGWLWYLVIW